MVAGYALYEDLICSQVTIAPCLCLLCDPISAQILFLLCLHYALCASFIPVHHPHRIWQTDLQLLSQTVQGVNWSKNVLCCANTHTLLHQWKFQESFFQSLDIVLLGKANSSTLLKGKKTLVSKPSEKKIKWVEISWIWLPEQERKEKGLKKMKTKQNKKPKHFS